MLKRLLCTSFLLMAVIVQPCLGGDIPLNLDEIINNASDDDFRKLIIAYHKDSEVFPVIMDKVMAITKTLPPSGGSLRDRRVEVAFSYAPSLVEPYLEKLSHPTQFLRVHIEPGVVMNMLKDRKMANKYADYIESAFKQQRGYPQRDLLDLLYYLDPGPQRTRIFEEALNGENKDLAYAVTNTLCEMQDMRGRSPDPDRVRLLYAALKSRHADYKLVLDYDSHNVRFAEHSIGNMAMKHILLALEHKACELYGAIQAEAPRL